MIPCREIAASIPHCPASPPERRSSPESKTPPAPDKKVAAVGRAYFREVGGKAK